MATYSCAQVRDRFESLERDQLRSADPDKVIREVARITTALYSLPAGCVAGPVFVVRALDVAVAVRCKLAALGFQVSGFLGGTPYSFSVGW